MGVIGKIVTKAATSIVKDVTENIASNATKNINSAVNKKMLDDDEDDEKEKQPVKRTTTVKKERKKSRSSFKCDFKDGMSQGEFISIVNGCLLKHPKVSKVLQVNPPKIKARAKKGLTGYEFSMDFNDYGKITGAYWISSDAPDKTIAIEVAEEIKIAIEGFYLDKGIDVAQLKNSTELEVTATKDTTVKNDASDEKKYNVIINKQTVGPLDISLFEQMVNLGQITSSTKVWKKGMKEWANASEIEELSAFFEQNDEMPPIPED